MITEDDLYAAAETIDEASDIDLSRRFSAMRAARKARTWRDICRLQAEIDSFTLNEAAYQLGRQACHAGDLDSAARWYQHAALDDFADSQLMLAKVLDSLTRQCLEGLEFSTPQRRSQEGLHLISKAVRWYTSAYASGELETAELIDNLIQCYDIINAQMNAAKVPAGG